MPWNAPVRSWRARAHYLSAMSPNTARDRSLFVDLHPCKETHKQGGPMRQEQAQSRGFTGIDACIFLLIQAEYRRFTGMGGVAELRARRSAARTVPWFVSHSRGALQGGFPANS